MLDVNKIIEESLRDSGIVTESIIGAGEAAKRTSQALADTLKGGSSQDEAAAAKEYALKALEKAKEENPGVLDKLKDSGEGIGEKISDTGKKVMDAVKEHPYASGGIAAALAAGLGALALRKRLKKLDQK